MLGARPYNKEADEPLFLAPNNKVGGELLVARLLVNEAESVNSRHSELTPNNLHSEDYLNA